MKFGRTAFTKVDVIKKLDMSMLEPMYEKLREVSERKKIPISTLIEIAVFKEFERGEDFNIQDDIDEDKHPYVENDNVADARRYYDFLKKYKGWNFSFHQLIFMYTHLGISSHFRALLALRELVYSRMVRLSHSRVAKYRKSSNWYMVKLIDQGTAANERQIEKTSFRKNVLADLSLEYTEQVDNSKPDSDD